MEYKPWEITPELTEERLCTLGKIIKDVRDKAVNSYNPADGDGLWSLGCLIYERTINKIEHEAKYLSWLDFYRKNLYFVIIIDKVPLRFYKGKRNKPTERILRQKYPEILEQLLFDFESRRERFWRIVVETESNGKVFRVLLVQYDKSGNTYNQWDIPITESIVSSAHSVRVMQREGIDLGKPIIRRRSKTSSEETKDVGKK